MRYITTFLATVSLLLASSDLGAQTRTVKGTVTDAATGEPLIGVSIAIEGTTRGQVTDLDGQYTIEADAASTLVFGYLGYKTVSEPVAGRSVINVLLESDINALDEVVLLGYSSVRKAELSSSVVSVQGEKLRDVTTPDLGTMLQGKVAGVNVFNSSGAPGAAATIRIRGTGSISASSDPLYVVDGVVGGTYSPNDVESITILKDAGSTALYGASGAGGVIVVTTKQAKKGQDAVVEFQANAGVKHALTGRYYPMDAYELYDVLSSANISVPKFVSEHLDTHNFDWVKEATRTGITQDYYVSASGSKNNTTYLASIDYYDEDGTAKFTDFRKITGRLNLGTAISRTLDLNVKMNYNRAVSHSGSVLGSAYSELPFDSPYDARTGDYVCITSARRPDVKGETWIGHDKYNPFYNQSVNSNESSSSQFLTDAQLVWRITDHLTLTSTNRYSSAQSFSESMISPESHNGTYPEGLESESVSWGRSYASTDILRYSQTFNGIHSVSGLLGYEYGYSYNRWMSASGSGINNGIHVLSSLAANGVGGGITEFESWSAFAQAMYSYREKYIVNATYRADASSVFAPNHRVGHFPSVSLAWIASSEDFMKNQEIISYLKVRASYGLTGNSGLEPYSYLDVYGFPSTAQYQGQGGAYPKSVANPDLHWETAHMANLGLDISFGNFLTFNVDVYNTENRDLLLTVPMSPSSGFESRIENYGTVRNRGLELQILTNNIQKRDLTWSTSFNIGFNKNVVISLPNHEDVISSNGLVRQIYREGEPLYSWYMPKWLGVDPENGDPLWEHIVRDEDGNPTGETVATNLLHLDEDAQIVGCAQPKFGGGLSNDLRWKNFTLSCTFQFLYGNDVFNWTRRVVDSDGAYSDYNLMSLNNGLGWVRWDPEDESTHAIATHPKAKQGGNLNSNESTSRYLEDGSYLRLKNVSIAYTLPRKLVSRVRLREAKVFLSGDNLWTWTRFSGMDPEVNIAGTINSTYPAGTYSYNYPVGRLFSVGVNVKF